MRFDWIDFDVAWDEVDATRSAIEKQFHNSTASLLAQFLRRRDVPYRKVFCWMRSATEPAEQSDTPGIRHIRATFPFESYSSSESSGRLVGFARWLVETLAVGAPELVRKDEIEVLISQIAEHQYIYRRTDRIRRTADHPACKIEYTHTPTDLLVTAACILPNGVEVVRALRHKQLFPDELVYGRAIKRAIVRPGNTFALETYFGEI
jgi:hypothetical protein